MTKKQFQQWKTDGSLSTLTDEQKKFFIPFCKEYGVFKKLNRSLQGEILHYCDLIQERLHMGGKVSIYYAYNYYVEIDWEDNAALYYVDTCLLEGPDVIVKRA